MDAQQTASPTPAPITAKGRRERRQYEAALKRQRALELRMGGYTYQQCADATGYKSRGAAKAAIKSALKAIDREAAEEVREMELARIEKMRTVLWPLVGKADLNAIDRDLKLSRYYAELQGLLRQKIEHSGPDGGPIQFSQLSEKEIDDLLAGLFAQVAARAEGTSSGAPGGEGAAGGGDSHAPDHA